MKFVLKEVLCKLINVNPRPEMHGDDKKPAADLKLSALLHNKELDQLHPGLRGAIYEKDNSQPDLVSQDDPEFLTALRFASLAMPLKWAGEQIGGRVIVHRGLGGKSDLVIESPVVNEFRVEALEGGSVIIGFRVQFKPDEKAIGKLCMLTGQDIVVSVEPPEDGELVEKEEDREPAEA